MKSFEDSDSILSVMIVSNTLLAIMLVIMLAIHMYNVSDRGKEELVDARQSISVTR